MARNSAQTRIKQAAPLYPIPQTKDDANDYISRIGAAQRERDRIQADMNDELSQIKERYELLAAPYKTEIEALSQGVHTWCEANRDALTQGGKVKYASLPSGEVKWRMRPPRVTLRAIDNIIAICGKLGLKRFVRVKEEINKEAMLAEPDIATSITGVSIDQGEDFVIMPFETELEEVA